MEIHGIQLLIDVLDLDGNGTSMDGNGPLPSIAVIDVHGSRSQIPMWIRIQIWYLDLYCRGLTAGAADPGASESAKERNRCLRSVPEVMHNR